jgi:hypothetical protein
MPEQNRSSEERILADRLCREALESRPAFSESLHERISCALRQAHGEVVEVATNRGVETVKRRRGLAIAVTAAGILCAMLVGWQLVDRVQRRGSIEDRQETAGPSIEDLRVIDQWAAQAANGLDGFVATATMKPQAEELKRDAQVVADAFLKPLPVNVQLVSDP